MVSYPYLDYVSWSPRGFVYDYTMNPWSRRTPPLEERQLPQQPRPCQGEEQNANQPAVEEDGLQDRISIWRRKLFDQHNVAYWLFTGTSLLFVISWVVTIALLIYHKKYFIITFVSILFLATLSAVFFRMLIATRNANYRHRQVQDSASNAPPSYETVVATPPDYNQLYSTTTSNETTAHNILDPEDASAAAANDFSGNPNDIVSLPGIGCSHERSPNATCGCCQALDGENPPSYEEVVFSSSSCRPSTHQGT